MPGGRRLGGRRLRAVASRDARALRGPAARTAVLRWGIAAAAVALLAASVATARDLDPRDRGVLQTGSTGVVVLDLSLSILDDHSGLIRRTLQRFVDADVPMGLVDLLRRALRAAPAGHAAVRAEAAHPHAHADDAG